MYEDIFIYYSKEFDGKIVYADRGAGVGLKYPKLVTSGEYAGRYQVVYASVGLNTPIKFTGRFFITNKEAVVYQIIYSESAYGYLYQDDFKYWALNPIVYSNDKTTAKATSVLSDLIATNQQILDNNLLCARAIAYATSQGITIPNDYRKKLYTLQSNLVSRNQQIKNSGVVEDVEESYSPNMSTYNNVLTDFMNNPGIGFVITSTMLIVSAAILVVGAVAGYILFKKLNTEANTDFKFSNELTADLMKYLPEKTYNQLMSENEANAATAKKAVSAAKRKAYFTMAKYAVIGFGGYYLIDRYIKNKV